MRKPLKAGRVRGTQASKLPLPSRGTARYIFTCAQNNTPVYKDVWYNLLALAAHYDAEVFVSRFTYDKSSYGENSVKPGTMKSSDYDGLWYDPELQPYFSDQRVEVAPGLVWCGELNILPTAVDPLESLEDYSGRSSGIIPHVKFAMASIAANKLEATKYNYTTGTVTLRNYIQKKAGLKAEPAHGYGALLVEVTPNGSWYVRQLQAAPGGAIRDLTLLAVGGEVSDGHEIEAITWGDLHTRQIDPTVSRLAWGQGGMLDVLKPRVQFIHDALDFKSRNHHDVKNPHKRFELQVNGLDSVEGEIIEMAEFLRDRVQREWCETVVVDSNHDRAYERWLREADYRDDPRNARFFLESQLAKYKSIEDRVKGFHLLEWAAQRAGCPEAVRFLREDESYVVCRKRLGGIECGMHGDRGPNGSKGALKSFAKMGRRTNTADAHSAGIYHGAWRAGTSSKYDLGYNKGPSSWSHSHIIVYPESTRSMVTMWDGRWRA